MKIAGVRPRSISGIRLVGMVVSLALSLAFAGDSFAALRHQYLFTAGGATAVDAVAGGVNGSVVGGASIDGADHRLVLDGTSTYIDIPGASLAINTYPNVTIETWQIVDPKHAGQYTASVGFVDTDAGGAGR